MGVRECLRVPALCYSPDVDYEPWIFPAALEEKANDDVGTQRRCCKEVCESDGSAGNSSLRSKLYARIRGIVLDSGQQRQQQR